MAGDSGTGTQQEGLLRFWVRAPCCTATLDFINNQPPPHMSLRFQPAPGTILNCDFSGYIVPEIVKTRQVVVVWKHKTNAKLVYIVPLSTTAPYTPALAHELASVPIPRQGQDPDTKVWVKCDMIYTVSTDRLSMPVNRASRRNAAPININLSTPDLMEVRQRIAKALRLG